MSENELGLFEESAQRLAAAAVPSRLEALLPCRPAHAGEDRCARLFVERLLTRAYRRPPSQEELAEMVGLFQEARAHGYDFDGAVRVVLEATLQAAPFLYRWDLVRQPPAVTPTERRRTAHARAARLSYFLWGAPPDPELLAAAEAGQLDTQSGREAQAFRLLADARARQTVQVFHREWLGLEELGRLTKSREAFPEFFGTGLHAAMEAELDRLVEHTLLEGDGRLGTLLSTSFSFVNEPLAKLYGLPPVSGRELRPAALVPSERFGLLTTAGLLAAKANAVDPSPVQRGLLVRDRLLCQPVPPPPPNMAEPPARDPRWTSREYFENEHENDFGCAKCHRRIDPIGFAFDTYDAIGRFRVEERGKPILTGGTLADVDGQSREFNGAGDLIAILAHSPQVHRCVARQWVRYALGRKETPADAPRMGPLETEFARSGDLRRLLVAIASGPLLHDEAP